MNMLSDSDDMLAVSAQSPLAGQLLPLLAAPVDNVQWAILLFDVAVASVDDFRLSFYG